MSTARAAAFPRSFGVTLEIERAAARAFGVCISATKDSNSSFKVSRANVAGFLGFILGFGLV